MDFAMFDRIFNAVIGWGALILFVSLEISAIVAVAIIASLYFFNLIS